MPYHFTADDVCAAFDCHAFQIALKKVIAERKLKINPFEFDGGYGTKLKEGLLVTSADVEFEMGDGEVFELKFEFTHSQNTTERILKLLTSFDEHWMDVFVNQDGEIQKKYLTKKFM